MILKQTFKNHFIAINMALTQIVMFFAIWWFIFDKDKGILVIFGLMNFVFIFPSFYLHIEYYLRNKGEEIEIDSDGITVRKNGESHSYPKEEIAKIIVYKSASMDKGGWRMSSMEYYYYTRIRLKTGKNIIITCLMTTKLEEALAPLRGITYQRKKSFFCTLLWK